MVYEDMGNSNGVVIFNESGFVKRGDDSAGVTNQYCGTAWKVENCQVGVFTAYASPHRYCLLDNQLFILENGLQMNMPREGKSAIFLKIVSLKQNLSWPQICFRNL